MLMISPWSVNASSNITLLDLRAWSYNTINIYSTKSYATAFGKKRQYDNAAVITEPDVYDQTKKRLCPWE